MARKSAAQKKAEEKQAELDTEAADASVAGAQHDEKFMEASEAREPQFSPEPQPEAGVLGPDTYDEANPAPGLEYTHHEDAKEE